MAVLVHDSVHRCGHRLRDGLRALDWRRMKLELEGMDPKDQYWYREIKPICGLVYPGPDPLGVGVGLCLVPASLVHDSHHDRHERTWTTEFMARPTRATIEPVTQRDKRRRR